MEVFVPLFGQRQRMHLSLDCWAWIWAEIGVKAKKYVMTVFIIEELRHCCVVLQDRSAEQYTKTQTSAIEFSANKASLKRIQGEFDMQELRSSHLAGWLTAPLKPGVPRALGYDFKL